MSAVQLGIIATEAALSRANIPAEAVEELYFGNVLSAGLRQAPARQVVIGSKMPDSTEATTINKVCASGLKSVSLASQNLQLGVRQVMVAGGMESMTNVPYYFPRGAMYGNQRADDGIIVDGFTDVFGGYHMGMCAENTASRDNITRKDQDDYAIESYRRAAQAWASGAFDNEIVPVTTTGRKPTVIKIDEEFTGIKEEKVPTLKPAFKADGTVTAANASSVNDGASAVTLITGEKAKELGVNQ